jgi:hypothetical protein
MGGQDSKSIYEKSNGEMGLTFRGDKINPNANTFSPKEWTLFMQ